MPVPLNSPRALEAVVHGEDGQLARCLIRPGQYIIGQGRKCEIVVNEASVSVRHARLTVGEDEAIYLEDLDSANGTFVDGQPAKGPTLTPVSAEVRLGTNTLRFCRGPLPAAVFLDRPPNFLQSPRYTMGEVVVQGSTSSIYEARDNALSRTVAMKVLLSDCQRDPEVVGRLLREAQLTGNLGHPGILPIYDLGLDEESRLYVTTRFMDAEPLSAVLERLAAGDPHTAERWPLSALLGVWQKACDVAAYAHSMGVVHGDLRPEVLQVGKFGEVYVTNWTVAKIVPPAEDEPPRLALPESYAVAAPGAYSAPEQAGGRYEEIDRAADIFSLGGVLYCLVTLRAPLQGETDDALLEAALSARVTPPAELPKDLPHPHWPRSGLPEYPAAVALKAMAYDPGHRHASVLELQHEISVWQQEGMPGKDGGKLWKQFAGLLGQR